MASRSLSSGGPSLGSASDSFRRTEQTSSFHRAGCFLKVEQGIYCTSKGRKDHITPAVNVEFPVFTSFIIASFLNQEAFPHPCWSCEVLWVFSALHLLTFKPRALQHSHYVLGILTERVAGRTFHSHSTPVTSTEMACVEKYLSGSIWCIFRSSFKAI